MYRATASSSAATQNSHRVRYPPSQNLAARPVHDRDEVEEASTHLDVGDVGAPDRFAG